MQHFFRCSRTNTVVGLTLGLSCLFLTSLSKASLADGRWVVTEIDKVYSNSPTPHPGSTTSHQIGQASSVSSYSYYSAEPGESSTSASIDIAVQWEIRWVDSDNQTPNPDHGYAAIVAGHADGNTTPSGALATSLGGDLASGIAPPSYFKTDSTSYPNHSPSTAPHVRLRMQAATSAGPDNTSDPGTQKEYYGQPTSAASGGSAAVDLENYPPDPII